MEKQRKRAITIVNRYYPPNPSITGDSACELAAYLLKTNSGIIVNLVSTDSEYYSNNSSLIPVGNTYSIRPLFKGKNKVLRFLGNFLEGYLLIKKAVFLKSDLIICLTDPPLVNFWAGYLCKKAGIPWLFWALDIYPEAFVSAKLVSKNNFFYKFLYKKIRQNFPNLIISLGEKQEIFLKHKFEREIKSIVLPCGIHNIPLCPNKPKWKEEDDKIYFAYAGNLGEAHSEHFLNIFISLLDPKKHKLVLSLYGSKSEIVIDHAKNIEGIVFVEKIQSSELAFIDIHIVSLLPEWTHLCVPSKAVSAICAGSTILFNGLEDSDTWEMFHEAGWIIPYIENIELERDLLKIFLRNLTSGQINRKKNAALGIAERTLKNKNNNLRKLVEAINQEIDR